MTRSEDINRFYGLLKGLEQNVGGKQKLKDCTGYMDWPERGVYFFFAPDETRDSSDQHRITRIGTHAVSEGSSASLWNRLRTHRGAMSGTYEGGGNHRGSVFRKRVGEAIIDRDGYQEEYPEWGDGSSAGRDLRLEELEMERKVSEYIRDLPFLWLNVNDEPSAKSQRAYIERNAIALLSNYQKTVIDARSKDWLGNHSRSEKIRRSGLWNVNHVEESYDSSFLDLLDQKVAGTSSI